MRYGIDLKTAPSLERRLSTPVDNAGEGRLVIVGASHMCRTAEYLSSECIYLAYPGFKPDREKIQDIANRLESLKLGTDDRVVLDLLSNSACMGTDGDGLPKPSYREGGGSYHILGSLTTAPPTNLKKALEACSPIIGPIGMSSVLLVVPIPRYVVGNCCADPNHVENFEKADFEDDLLEAQEQHRRILSAWGVAGGLNFDIIDPPAIVHPMEPLLRRRVTSGGALLWCQGDPVHLSPEAYRDLAGALREEGDGSVFGGPSVSTSSEGTKRKIPDSVVTKLVTLNAKRGKKANRITTAGWLTGSPPVPSALGRVWRGRGNRGESRGGGRWAPRWRRFGYHGRWPW